MADGDMARCFHRLTSYEAGREWEDTIDDPWIVTSFEASDLEIQPPISKQFPAGLPRLPLPRELPSPEVGTVAVLAREARGTTALDLAHLARLLHLSAGIVRTETRPGGRVVPFRAAGSAGARFPQEVYVAVPARTPNLPPGVHAYEPVEHALVQVAPPPRGEGPALIVTSVPWRTGWRYRERGYRHIFWDGGTMLAQTLALAASAGVPARLYTGFPDILVRDLVGANGIDEFPIAVVALGEGSPGWIPEERGAAGAVADGPVHFPLVTATHWAGMSTRWSEPWPSGDPVSGPMPDSPPVNDVVYQRGSTRRMDATRSVPREFVETALAVALRGTDLPHFVAAHGVDGVRPGLYSWPDLDHPIREGNLRAELQRLALAQGLASDAAFVAIGAADLSEISDHRYRELQLAAGLVAGRLHLAAYALGYGASGMTFLDAEMPDFLGEALQAMLLTCVGVPEYRNRPGGPPGKPVRVRGVVPRVGD